MCIPCAVHPLWSQQVPVPSWCLASFVCSFRWHYSCSVLLLWQLPSHCNLKEILPLSENTIGPLFSGKLREWSRQPSSLESVWQKDRILSPWSLMVSVLHFGRCPRPQSVHLTSYWLEVTAFLKIFDKLKRARPKMMWKILPLVQLSSVSRLRLDNFGPGRQCWRWAGCAGVNEG